MIGKMEITATKEGLSSRVDLKNVSVADKIHVLCAVASGLELSPEELKAAAFTAAIAMEVGIFSRSQKQVANEG